MIENYFKEKNIKLTKQRKMVFEVIEKLEEAKLKDIQKLCNEKVDNSTIYRIIDLFLEKGIVEKNIDSYNNIVYSINKNEHKHYIYCVKCHKKEIINVCPVSNIENNGYKLLSHQIKLDGICGECQKK